jgi:hypothetical protein
MAAAWIDAVPRDVAFVVGPGRVRMEAHRVVLAARSPMFAAMFFSNFLEGRWAEVQLPDVDAELFSELLACVYDKPAQLTLRTLVPMMELCRCFQVEAAARQCHAFVRTLSGCEAAAALEATPEVLGEERRWLADAAAARFLELAQHSSLVRLSKETLMRLGASEELGVSEAVLFCACVRWAVANAAPEDDRKQAESDEKRAFPGPGDAETDASATTAAALLPTFLPPQCASWPAVRAALAGFLPLVRFGLMSSEQLATLVVPLDVLSPAQLADVFRAKALGLAPQLMAAKPRRATAIAKPPKSAPALAPAPAPAVEKERAKLATAVPAPVKLSERELRCSVASTG